MNRKNLFLFFVGLLYGTLLFNVTVPRDTLKAATIAKGYTFATNELVTAAKLHSLVDSAVITLQATDFPTLSANTITSSNIIDGSIVGSDIASRTITSSLIATGAVTSVELATNITFQAGTLTFSTATPVFSANQILASYVVGVTNSAGAGDANKIVKLNPSGQVDSTMLPSTSAFTSTFTSANQTITSAGSLTIAHSLGAAPTLVQLRLKCTSAELGYSINDEVVWDGIANNPSSNQGISCVPDASNINIRFGSGSPCLGVIHKTTGAPSNIDQTKWVLIIKAWK